MLAAAEMVAGRRPCDPTNYILRSTMTIAPKRKRALILLTVAGLVAAVLALLEPILPGLADLCGRLGGSCRDTAAYTLLGIPIAVLGLVYYVVLLASGFIAPASAFWLVMAGGGVEATFLYMMVAHGIFCPFCLLNLLVVVALVALMFSLVRVWQAMAVGLLFMLISLAALTDGNGGPARGQAATVFTPDVVARVAGVPVTAAELERAMAGQIYRARMDLYEEKRKRLDQIIEERLFNLEAEKRGIAVEALRAEALKPVEPVGPEEVGAYLEANPGIRPQWKGTEKDLQERVRDYLQRLAEARVLRAYLDGLKKRYPVAILLEEPLLPLTRVALGNSPSQGPANAPVTVVEFSDYLCSACRRAHEIVKDLHDAYDDRVRWVFKDFPLERHRAAFKMAEAGRCALDQERFWEFQDLLFKAPADLDTPGILRLADQLGLDGQRFEQCLKDGAHHDDVLADIRAGKAAGVDATPTFIVNGKLKPGIGRREDFQAILEAELAAAGHPAPSSKAEKSTNR